MTTHCKDIMVEVQCDKRASKSLMKHPRKPVYPPPHPYQNTSQARLGKVQAFVGEMAAAFALILVLFSTNLDPR